MTAHVVQQRSSPPPNFPANLHMIKEDATDGHSECVHKEGETAGSEEYGSESERKSKLSGLRRPQISITDAQGYVTAVPAEEGEMMIDDTPLGALGLGHVGASGLSVSSMPGLASASKTSDLSGLGAYQVNHAGSANMIPTMGMSGSALPSFSYDTHTSLAHQFHKIPFSLQYPGLNLANIPPDDSMEVESESSGGAALGYPTLQSMYPTAMGLLDYQSLSLAQYAALDRPHMLHQEGALYRFTQKDQPLGAYAMDRCAEVPLTTRRGSQTLGSTGSTPEKDLHQETFSPNEHPTKVPPEAQEPAHSAMLEALNLHNGLADMRQNLCYALSLSLTSKRTMSEILKEIKQTLDHRSPNVVYQFAENRFRLENSGGVQMEMEVYPGVTERGLRIRKLAGDTWQYNRLCNEIITGMNL